MGAHLKAFDHYVIDIVFDVTAELGGLHLRDEPGESCSSVFEAKGHANEALGA